MNLNDLRANAYKVNSSSSEEKKTSVPEEKQKSSDKITEKSGVDYIYKTNDTGDLKRNTKINGNVIKNVKRSQSANPVLDAAEQALISGGLVKVPVSERQADGSDSIYRRVAKFLLIIGVDEAAKILPHLTPEQTERIIPEIASIRSVSPEEAEVILTEFQSLLERSRQSGGVDTARSILEKAYGPERAQELLDKAVPLEGKIPFDYLNDADTERIYFLLKDESSAVQALVLSRLQPKKAASVINQMDADNKKEIVLRLAKMESVSPEVIRRLDQAMREKSLAQTSQKAENIDGRNALAEILKKMSPAQENTILSALSEDDPDLGMDLRTRLFTIDDVIESDDRFIQEYLRDMSNLDIACLIAGKPDNFRDKIFNCVSQGRKAQIQDEEDFNKPFRKADCEKITSLFFSTLRRAWEEGKLIVKNRTDDIYI